MNVNKPIDKINIGYNKSPDEYIGLLEEKNKIKKDIERSRDYQEKQKIIEKEQGFNIHFSGANEERIKEQRRQEILKNSNRAHSSSDQQNSLAQQQQQRVRRMWKNPNSVEGRSGTDNQPDSKYTNPFDLGGYNNQKLPPQPILAEKSPSKIRKRWGNNQGISGPGPTKAIHNSKQQNDDDDEDDYSDSFEEIQQDFEEEDEEEKDYFKKQDQTRKQNESGINDDYGYGDDVGQDNDIEDKGDNDIEQFLKTATMNDINALRQSLSNFGEMSKQLNAKKDVKKEEDDYIEEDFEEHIESDEDQDSEEERKQEEKIRQEQQKLQQLRQAQQFATQNTTRGAKNRPISATYSLATSQKVQSQRNDPPTYIHQQTQQIASVRDSKNYNSNSGIPSSHIQETPKQPNDILKKPINTNPFKRPFSQNVPKRETNQVQTSKDQNQMIPENISSNQVQNKTSDNAFQKVPIASILQKIEQLEDWQKEKLMELLNNFDSLTSSQMQTQVNKISQEKKPDPKSFDLNFLSPSKKGVTTNQSQQFFKNPNKTEVVIKVIKTYGNPHLCGLTEIEIFDSNAKKILLAPANIIPKNLGGNGPKITTARLIDGFKLTNDEKHMWIGYLPIFPQNLELLIQLEKDTKIGGLKIWNYNKSTLDCTKGVKEIQITIDGENVWEGILESGRGSTTTEYATFIPLNAGIQLPREIQIQEAIQEEYEEEESKDNIVKQQEEFKKYRSELNVKQQVQPQLKDEKSALWLPGNQSSVSNLAQQNLYDRSQQKTQQKPRGELNTFDLLDKYQFNDNTSQTTGTSSTKNHAQSAVGQSRPHPLREQQKPGQTPASIIKPNASQASQAQIKNKPFDLGVGQLPPANNKQWTQPFQAPKSNVLGQNSLGTQALQETSDAILKAVNKVNQVMNNQINKHKPIQVEESLDNLDFFKATNRGRLMNFNDEDKKTQQQQQEQAKPSQRQRWGISPGKQNNNNLQESQLSSASKHKGAHVVVKNPFPDQQNSGLKPSARRRQEGDILDQLLSNDNQIKAQQSHQQKDQIHHLNFIGQNEFQSKYGSKQSSLSPARESSQPKSKTLSYEDKLTFFTESFFIPNLPTGSKLHFNILSTWGDMNYVGLTGIEIFDIEGKSVQLQADQISACPPDINILPGYGGDPRTVDKLIDGHFLTNDDLHVWLTPFTAGEDHTIDIELGNKKTISMIRIWNYNKSRIHSYRGARLIECRLDDKMIFRGEIQKAPGNLNDPENCCEIIMFTDNEAILQRIDLNDWINEQVVKSGDMENTQKPLNYMGDGERPMTATRKFSTQEMQEIQKQLKQQKPTSLFDERPQTSAIITGDQEERKEQQSSSLRSKFDQKHQDLSSQVKWISQQTQSTASTSIRGRVIDINILESWGDLFYVGLTGLEIYDDRDNPIHITLSMVDANPRDMNSIPGHGTDYRTLDKLINKINNTIDDHNMWLVPFNKGENHTIKIDLGKVTAISGIKFYNYNKSEEDTLRGAKQVVIQVDKKFVTPKKGITIRKAPGLVHPLLDMGQLIKLPFKQGWTTDQIVPIQRQLGELGLFQEYEIVNLPIGFLYRLNLYTTHGDFYYIGLNGLEFYDQNGIPVKIKTIIAEPQGVNKLPGMESDVRVVQNLINGVNQTFEEYNMWLVPFKNTRSYSAVSNAASQKEENQSQEYRIPNYVYVVFDQLTAVSAIRLWNYSKTPSRGVNEFEVLVDDKQIYRGFAKIAPEKGQSGFNQDFSTVVLFTTEQKIIDKFKNSINYDTSKQQNVTLVNEKKLMNKNQVRQRPNEEFVFNDMQRPTTMARRH